MTTPDVPPYSSTTTASCMPPCAQLEQQRVEPQRLGHEHGLHHERRHRHVAAPVERHGDGLLDVHDAVDVVPVGADDREARVPGAPRQARRRRPRSRCARSTVARERGVMTSAAVWSAKPRDAVTSRAVPRSSVPASADVRTSEASSAGLRAADSSSCGSMPEGEQGAVGDAVEQQDHRLHRDAEPAHGRGRDLRGGQRQRDGERLGHHLADDHREHGGDEHREHRGRRRGRRRRQPQRLQRPQRAAPRSTGSR